MIPYRREMDGLRTLAIVPVVTFHFSSQALKGGFLGVDVFFVISGFLITSILFTEVESRSFSPKIFWTRRIKRILPALTLMIFITAMGSLLLLPKWRHAQDGWQGISGILSYANISLWRMDDNYWGPRSGESLFLHCWSLSIEEQFYLLFPILVYVLRNKKSLLVFAISAGFIVSLGLFVYSTRFHNRAAFYLLPMRAWEIGAGCLLATAMLNGHIKKITSTNVAGAIQWSGISMIGLSYFFINAENRTPMGVIWPVLGTVMVIWSTTSFHGLLVKILSLGPLVFIGKVSYSIYLWHWPIICLSNQLPYEIPMAAKLLALVSLSIGSYYFIELPFRRNKNGLGIISAMAFTTISLLAFMGFKNSDYDISQFANNVLEREPYDLTPSGGHVGESMAIVPRHGVIKNYSGIEASPALMVLGDSHALMWSSLIDSIAKELGICVSFNGISGVSSFFKIPIVDEWSARGLALKPYRQYILDKIEKWDAVILISNRWSHTSLDESADLLNYLSEAGKTVVVIEDPPELYFEHQDTRRQLAYRGKFPVAGVNQYLELTRNPKALTGDILPEIVRKFPNCSLVPIKDLFLKSNKAWVLRGKDVLYFDGDHLSTQGALIAHDRIKAQLVKALTKGH